MIHHIKYAQEKDLNDPLKDYRKRFVNDDKKLIYLDGNSLGKLPIETIEKLNNSIKHEWGSRLIRSWNENWFTKNQEIGKKIAKLIGAKPNEVIIADSTSINLYKLAFAALSFLPNRNNIISDNSNFPSDLYILQGLIQSSFPKHQLHIVYVESNWNQAQQAYQKTINEKTALVTLSHVAFKSSYCFNMEATNKIIHQAGAIDLWDLSHSTGAVPLALNKCNTSLAVGCTYKYLNGGPGSPAFLYVREDLQEKLLSPITGWLGASNPFEFKLDYQPANNLLRFITGTPPILSLTGISTGVDLLLDAGMQNIRKKSVEQTNYFIELYLHFLAPLGFQLVSPKNDDQRGSHISLSHPEAHRLCKALIDDAIGDYSIIPDFRKPNIIRFGITPLYTSFQDIYIAITELKTIIDNQWHQNIDIENEVVT